MKQKYRLINEHSNESLKKFLSEGKDKPLCKRILYQLQQHPLAAFELEKILKCRKTSLYRPLLEYINTGIVVREGSRYDHSSRRYAGLYWYRPGEKAAEKPKYPIQAKLFNDEDE